jgi:hypothetical protein
VHQLQEQINVLTAQCAQLDEANRAWQVYQQTQIDTFVDKLRAQVTLDSMTSFDQIADMIVNQIQSERDNHTEKYQLLEKVNSDHRSGNNTSLASHDTIIFTSIVESATAMEAMQHSYINAINELSEESLGSKEAYAQLEAENQNLKSQLKQYNDHVQQEHVQQQIGTYSDVYLHNIHVVLIAYVDFSSDSSSSSTTGIDRFDEVRLLFAMSLFLSHVHMYRYLHIPVHHILRITRMNLFSYEKIFSC